MSFGDSKVYIICVVSNEQWKFFMSYTMESTSSNYIINIYRILYLLIVNEITSVYYVCNSILSHIEVSIRQYIVQCDG